MKNDQQSHCLLDLIGQTPLLLLKSFSTTNLQLFAKLEGYNPGSSLYDRLARSLVEHAESTLGLQAGSLLIENSSSELSVSVAMVGAAKGYRVHCIVSPELSAKTRQIITAYGASIEEAQRESSRAQLAEKWVDSHSDAYLISPALNEPLDDHSLAADLYAALDGQIDACVFPLSSAHLLDSSAKYLKQKNPAIRILAVDDRAAEDQANLPISPLVDEVVVVDDTQRLLMCKELVLRESLLTGPVSGAVMHATVQAAESWPVIDHTPTRIVAILPEHGDRYLHWLQGANKQEPVTFVVS